MPKTFLIIDDHAIMRKGLQVFLRERYPMSVINEAADTGSALEQLRMHPFDLIVLDIKLPGTTGMEFMTLVKTLYPQTPVLIFSVCPENIYGLPLVRSGAHGYLSKEASLQQLHDAVQTVLNGGRYMSRQLVNTMIGELGNEQTASPFARLSKREFEISHLMLTGLSVSEMAVRTHLHPSTVGTYKRRIFEKLEVANTLELKEMAQLYLPALENPKS